MDRPTHRTSTPCLPQRTEMIPHRIVREFIANCHDNYRGLLIILLLSFVLKLVIVLSADVINYDGVVYVNAAWKLADGRLHDALKTYPMVFYPLLIAIAHFIIPDWTLAGQFISATALLLTLVPVYLITKELFNAKAAFYAALAFALSPMINGYSADIYRDPIHLFFFSTCAYFLIKAICEKRIQFYLWAGLFTLLAFLCRVEAVVLPLVAIPMMLILSIFQPAERRDLLLGVGIYGGGLFAVAFGSILVMASLKGLNVNRVDDLVSAFNTLYQWDFLNNYLEIYKELEVLQHTVPGWGYLAHNFIETTRHYLWLIYLVGTVEASAKLLFFIFLIPLMFAWVCPKEWDRKTGFLVLLSIACFLIGYVFLIHRDFLEKRYMLPFVVLLYPWVGKGMFELQNRISLMSWKFIAQLVFLSAFVMLPLIDSVSQVEPRDDAVKKAGLWIASHPKYDNAVILSEDPRVYFYAQREGPEINLNKTKNPTEQLEYLARKTGADLIAVAQSNGSRKKYIDTDHYREIETFKGNRRSVTIYQKIHP